MVWRTKSKVSYALKKSRDSLLRSRMKHQIRRPVDISDTFKKSGMTLITDIASEKYLKPSNDNTKLDSPL